MLATSRKSDPVLGAVVSVLIGGRQAARLCRHARNTPHASMPRTGSAQDDPGTDHPRSRCLVFRPTPPKAAASRPTGHSASGAYEGASHCQQGRPGRRANLGVDARWQGDRHGGRRQGRVTHLAPPCRGESGVRRLEGTQGRPERSRIVATGTDLLIAASADGKVACGAFPRRSRP